MRVYFAFELKKKLESKESGIKRRLAVVHEVFIVYLIYVMDSMHN